MASGRDHLQRRSGRRQRQPAGAAQLSQDLYSTRPLLDKLGVKPDSKVAILDLDDQPAFLALLRSRTRSVVRGKPKGPCDLVFLSARQPSDLGRLSVVKSWIEPNGAIWVIRPKGRQSKLNDVELIHGGLAAGLVDNKIASFSETHGAMRFVFRLRDRPK